MAKVTLALQWHTQCQFAGYYVALDKGFYKEEGIDLMITPGATDINPINLVSSGVADFGTKWLADFMVAKDKGHSLVSIAQVLQSNGLFTYAPNDGFVGTDSFTYVAGDGPDALVIQALDGNLATVSITVEPFNHAPIAADDSYSVSEDGVLLVDASGVLANDADVEGDPLTAVLVDGPLQGALTLGKDGSFEYTPNPDFNGSDSFTYVPNDGQADGSLATVSITVESVDIEQAAELAVELEVSATAFGPEAEVTWVGSTFWVNAYVEDLRDMPQGVVGGAVDILFDSPWVDPTGEVAYGEDFTAFQQGTPDDAAGLIDEAGALTTEGGVGTDAPAPFVAWQFVWAGAEGAGTVGGPVQFAVEPAQGTATITPANFALVGSGDPDDWALVEMGAVALEFSTPDFNGDGLANHFDLALWQPHSGEVLGDPGFDPLYDLNVDGQINEQDLDLLMGALYQPIGSEPVAPQVTSASDPSTDDADEDLPTGPRGRGAHWRHGVRRLGRLRAVDAIFSAHLSWW